jgi:NAD(P)-dependent dehydrogenase (short-subunit alcohol dehydrogenase family)
MRDTCCAYAYTITVACMADCWRVSCAAHLLSSGAESPIQRPGEPKEAAAVFVFLASQESSYVTSEVSNSIVTYI